MAVVVIGETPYAEMMGDRDDLSVDEVDVATVKRVAEHGMPVVVVLVSDRPLILRETLDASSAFVAAWLPGTEGKGVADVLFGDYSPTGSSPSPGRARWTSCPSTTGMRSTIPSFFFPYGFGLGY